MKLIIEKEIGYKPKWICLSTFEERFIPKKAGFSWGQAKKRWYTIDWSVAKKLIEYADHEARQEIQIAEQQAKEAVEKSSRVDSHIEIPVPEGLFYLGYQKAGIEYASEKTNCLIADEMGLGKTIQAIGLINLKKIKKVLIICPSFLKLNWKKELEKWLVEKHAISIVSGNFENADINIINYDILKKYSEKLQNTEYELAIFDESHYIKNFKASRTKAALKIKAKQKVFLTGTPVLNRPVEMFTVLNSANIPLASNWYIYVSRFCHGKKTRYGWDVRGASNQEELGRKLREQIMVRRLKKDVLNELPEKTRQIITLDEKIGGNELKKEQKAFNNYAKKTKEIKKSIAKMRKEKQTDTKEYKKAIEKMKEFQADFLKIAELRHKTALKKIDSAIEQIEINLESNPQIIVFAHHTDFINDIEKKLKEKEITVGKITGSTPQEKRQEIIDQFQEGKLQVFLGSTMACGVGITLTNASVVLFLEMEWSPSIITQAEDRAHRIGQINNVLVQFLVFDNSIDAMLAKKIAEKEAIIESILN